MQDHGAAANAVRSTTALDNERLLEQLVDLGLREVWKAYIEEVQIALHARDVEDLSDLSPAQGKQNRSRYLESGAPPQNEAFVRPGDVDFDADVGFHLLWLSERAWVARLHAAKGAAVSFA